MEATTLFLLLLLPPADTAGDSAAGIQASLRRELGDVSMAVAPDTLVTPSMWQGEKAQMRARFVVRVTWKTKDEAKVDLLAGANAASKTYSGSRELAFAAEDSKAERGRALGLVIAELLRSSPAWAWAGGGGGASPAQPTGLEPSWVNVGAMFASERAMSGVWASGPALAVAFNLSEAFQVRAAGFFQIGSGNQYRDMGLMVGASWDFLRVDRNRYALGVGASVGGFSESATFGLGEHAVGDSKARFAAEVDLRGRVTIWKSLRLVAEGGLRALSDGMSAFVRGDDGVPDRTYTTLRTRPTFTVGLELAL
jgi:hypothetical protein